MPAYTAPYSTLLGQLDPGPVDGRVRGGAGVDAAARNLRRVPRFLIADPRSRVTVRSAPHRCGRTLLEEVPL